MPHETPAIYRGTHEFCQEVRYIPQYDAHFCYDDLEWIEEKCENFCVVCFNRPRTPSERREAGT